MYQTNFINEGKQDDAVKKWQEAVVGKILNVFSKSIDKVMFGTTTFRLVLLQFALR